MGDPRGKGGRRSRLGGDRRSSRASWLALFGLAHAVATGLLAAFLMFRLLDIAKPGPIGWADRQSGAAGIMADDVIAGAITAGIVWAIGAHWPSLFG